MDRSVKFAQQVLNRMVVFPSSPPTLFPPESFRLAVTVRVVTPTETQSPCRQQQTADMQRFIFKLVGFIIYFVPSLKDRILVFKSGAEL